MKGLCFFVVVALICTGCSWAGRDAVRSQVRQTADKLSHPTGSVIVLTVDDLLPAGSSETCFASSRDYLIGTSLSPADIYDHYNRQIGSDWVRVTDPNHPIWSMDVGRFGQTISILYRDSALEANSKYRDTVMTARTQYSTTYVLYIGVVTADTCKG